MKALLIACAFAFAATPALAVPMCYAPKGGGLVITLSTGNLTEADESMFYEMQLRAKGVDARQVVMWNGCVQAIVTEDGRSTMRFYDPWTLEEIPVD
jgi:hypothetical protein